MDGPYRASFDYKPLEILHSRRMLLYQSGCIGDPVVDAVASDLDKLTTIKNSASGTLN